MLREKGRWQKKDGRRKILPIGHSPSLGLSRYHGETRGEPLLLQIVKNIYSNSASPLTACYHRGIDGLVVVALFLPQLN